MKLCMLCCLTVGSAVAGVQGQALAQLNAIDAAQSLGKTRTAAGVQPDGLYVCEAEEFQSRPPQDHAGWRAQRFGENYYAATFANSFLSRKAFLGAPEQCDETVASLDVDVKEAGRYLVLVRYEAAYRFETQFRVQVEQAGQIALDRLYGARTNLKIWAFSQKLKTEVGWSWGAVENVVWEGHDAFANLQPGRATIRLIAAKQPEPAAKRNVDLVMLTTDVEQVTMRIDKERYLPLDGMLTQSGDVFLRVSNLGGQPLTFTGKGAPAGGNWQQHSPYWVHLRNWTTPSIQVAPGKTSEWVEVGGTMDSLADGQWFWTGNGKYKAEFGLRGAAGQLEPLAIFTGEGDLTLAADADTRYARRLLSFGHWATVPESSLTKAGAQAFARLRSLESLHAGEQAPPAGGSMRDLTEAVAKIETLKSLTLAFTSVKSHGKPKNPVTAADLEPLAALANLERLGIQHASLDGATASKLAEIGSVNIVSFSVVQLDDGALVALKALPNLAVVEIWNSCDWSDADLEALKAAKPKVRFHMVGGPKK